MAKAEIELTDEQMERLKRVAEDRGMPVIELVASSIERTLAEAERSPRKRGTGDPSRFIGCIKASGHAEQETGGVAREEQWERAMSVVGKFSSGLGDLSTNHDKYLAEA